MWKTLRGAMWSRDLDVLCSALYHDHAALAARDGLHKLLPSCYCCDYRRDKTGDCDRTCSTSKLEKYPNDDKGPDMPAPQGSGCCEGRTKGGA
jgi:hypothetical protein